MDIHVTTRHCTLTEEENDAAIAAAKQFEKFVDGIIRVDVICDENATKHVEYTVKVPGQKLVAKESGQHFSKIIHDAALKMQRQLSRLHEQKIPVRSPERG